MRIFAIAVGAVALAGTAVAATPALDDASDPAYDDGWTSGDDGGSGWDGGWSGLVPPATYGIATSTANGDGDTDLDGDIDTGVGRAWAITVNTLGQPANASRSFDGVLEVGQTVGVAMDHDAVSGSGTGGIRLISTLAEQRFALLWFGSLQAYYAIGDTSEKLNVPHGDEGLAVAFHLTGSDTYSLDLTPLGGTTTNFQGTLAAGTSLNRLILNASSSGASETWFFNSIAVPEPRSSASALVAMGALSLCRRGSRSVPPRCGPGRELRLDHRHQPASQERA